MTDFEDLLARVRSCRACEQELPAEPRPVFQISRTARLLIASQAPGSRVQASGIPFSDPSGDRLREWTGLSSAQFYEARDVAILPMGFCYPGKGAGGDAPPRRECARLWRASLLAQMPDLRLTLLVGTYAQHAALGPGRMAERVRNFSHYLPDFFPLPHPSWRSLIWSRQNPWFDEEVIPALRAAVRTALGRGASR